MKVVWTNKKIWFNNTCDFELSYNTKYSDTKNVPTIGNSTNISYYYMCSTTLTPLYIFESGV